MRKLILPLLFLASAAFAASRTFVVTAPPVSQMGGGCTATVLSDGGTGVACTVQVPACSAAPPAVLPDGGTSDGGLPGQVCQPGTATTVCDGSISTASCLLQAYNAWLSEYGYQ